MPLIEALTGTYMSNQHWYKFNYVRTTAIARRLGDGHRKLRDRTDVTLHRQTQAVAASVKFLSAYSLIVTEGSKLIWSFCRAVTSYKCVTRFPQFTGNNDFGNKLLFRKIAYIREAKYFFFSNFLLHCGSLNMSHSSFPPQTCRTESQPQYQQEKKYVTKFQRAKCFRRSCHSADQKIARTIQNPKARYRVKTITTRT